MKSTSCLHAAAQFVCQHWFPAKGGCLLQLVQSIGAFLGPTSPQKALNAACEAGALESTLEYFLSRTTPNWREALRAAAQGGHLHVLRWMTNRQDGRGLWNTDFDNLLEVAASHGHLDVAKWLFERGADWYTMWRLKRSTRGYYTLAWSYEHYLREGLRLAAENGHLAVVQWLHGVQTQRGSSDSMFYAVARGHLAMAQWLFENGLGECSTNAVDAAAKGGHLDMLQWLHSKHLLRCTNSAFDGAAENGHLAVLQWLHEILVGGCSSAKLYLPIQNGHLEVVKWLDANVPVYVHREIGSSSRFAARYGH